MESRKWEKNTRNLILVHSEDLIFILNFNFMFSFFPQRLIWLYGGSRVLYIRLLLISALISIYS